MTKIYTKVVKCERCKCVIGTIQESVPGGDATGLCSTCAEKEIERGGAKGPKRQAVEYVGRKGRK